jgi:glucose uptake protein GlcU
MVAFADKGLEPKNGSQLHRLEFVNQSVFNSYMQQSLGSDVQASGFTFTVWVKDDGTPADMQAAGSLTATVSGQKLAATMIEEFRIFALSGVSISAPI